MESVSIGLAFVAGVVSFASPCVLALVPVYLAFLGETAAGGPSAATATLRTAVLAQALLFVAGFTLVFVLFGTSVGLLGSALFRVDAIRQVAGVLVIALGVATTGVFGRVFDRFSPAVETSSLPAARSARSVALGALVAVGWTPCIGPVLGAILTMGFSSQSAGIAAVLLLAYSAGLAAPFLAAALALPRVRPLFEGLRRHQRIVEVVAGLFIIGIGLLILTNAFARLAGLFTFVL
ncbi:MAG TPA: cytochrome c biogenesis protein CcdA [Candidatus Limnocylindria bacterium]|nr:cytochrome c biogenesis protein CcdA [Candidatus Limnocylindria bacterium]